jgi:phage shock protein E
MPRSFLVASLILALLGCADRPGDAPRDVRVEGVGTLPAANPAAAPGERVEADPVPVRGGAGEAPRPGGNPAPGANPAAPTAGAAAGEAAAEPARRTVYVDVRERHEWAAGHVEGAVHIPVGQMPARWSELEVYRDDDLVLYCRSGRRSGTALQILEQAGFSNARNGGAFADLARQGVPTAR